MLSGELSSRERLIRQVKGQEIDRIPSLGGWINGAANIAEIGGISLQEYLRNPEAGVIRANRALGVDGVVVPVIPDNVEEIRHGGAALDSEHPDAVPEDLVVLADSLPSNDAGILKNFDFQADEKKFRDYFDHMFSVWKGIEPIPNFWDIGGHFPLYHEFGYEAFLMACGLYPEAVNKIWYTRSLVSRERAKILVKLYKEYDLVPLMFCGEDLCNQTGPMVSPEFLREYYFPTVKMINEPLVNSGIRLIHHCDGDVRPLVQDFLHCGFSGLQGFQYECNVNPFELKKLRSNMGEELLFFAGLSVTYTLPFGTREDVRNEVEYLVDYTDGGRSMFMFTSNVTGVEVPTANIQAAYRYLGDFNPKKPHKPEWREWPWKATHP
ncbi:MAG: hypothetical protein JEY99_18990 [Spirochaetales bacterium]|nr:hypothetical protein [Spirochaetales bacterium]